MGRSAKCVLVMACCLAGLTAIGWQRQAATGTNDRVQVEDYQDFWLWPGNFIPTNIAKINNLYILQGEFLSTTNQSNLRLTGLLPSRLAADHIWLVFRVEQAHWSDEIAAAVNQRIKLWETQGNRVAGIQIDFDAKSSALADYAGFLRQVRQRLPEDYQLSVTGLLDWSNASFQTGLANIRQTVDEIIFQTYQGRSTIGNYQRYLAALSKQTQPFKIGVIEKGLWQQDSPHVKELINNRHFIGFVVFLNNQNRIDKQ